MNSRLDTIQAAVLQVKLQAFEEYELEDVNRVAACLYRAVKRLREGAGDSGGISIPAGHQYSILSEG